MATLRPGGYRGGEMGVRGAGLRSGDLSTAGVLLCSSGLIGCIPDGKGLCLGRTFAWRWNVYAATSLLAHCRGLRRWYWSG